MWEVWTDENIVSQAEVDEFDANFKAFYDEYDLEASRAYVSDFYTNKEIKTTDEEKRYYFLAVSKGMNVLANNAKW